MTYETDHFRVDPRRSFNYWEFDRRRRFVNELETLLRLESRFNFPTQAVAMQLLDEELRETGPEPPLPPPVRYDWDLADNRPARRQRQPSTTT